MNPAARLEIDLIRIARLAREGFSHLELTKAAIERLDRENGLREGFKAKLWGRLSREHR